MEKKTPLYECHVALQGKMVPFAGYLLPVQYPTGVIAEHMAVRTACGLFDVSHMGEVMLQGPAALENLQRLLTNDMSGMVPGQVRYSPLCNDRGGVVDDLLVYCFGQNDYMIVVNAANRHKDVAWMKERIQGDATLIDESDSWAQVALQGPHALDILKGLAPEEEIPKRYYTFVREGHVAGIPCIISRTGYTGEAGFELYCANDKAAALWSALLEAGAAEGLIPCGLGARDTLRLEASMPLYGHEMDDTITPLETGLDFFVKMEKPDFIGKSALEAAGAPRRQRVGIEITGRGIAREQSDVYKNGEKVGITTSGTFSPFLQKAVAMALVQAGSLSIDDVIEVDVRGRRIEGKVVPLPFYKRPKKA